MATFLRRSRIASCYIVLVVLVVCFFYIAKKYGFAAVNARHPCALDITARSWTDVIGYERRVSLGLRLRFKVRGGRVVTRRFPDLSREKTGRGFGFLPPRLVRRWLCNFLPVIK